MLDGIAIILNTTIYTNCKCYTAQIIASFRQKIGIGEDIINAELRSIQIVILGIH